jgi:hypothetical protein
VDKRQRLALAPSIGPFRPLSSQRSIFSRVTFAKPQPIARKNWRKNRSRTSIVVGARLRLRIAST